MENEVLAARYNRLLQKLLTMKGPVPAPQLSGDIMAAIILENDRLEFSYLSGEAHFAGATVQAALAANLSAVGIFNGQATGALVVVDYVIITNPDVASHTFNINIGATTGLSGTFHQTSTDMRWLGKSSTAVIGTFTEGARTGQTILQVAIPQGDAKIIPVRIVLPPNVTPAPAGGPPNVVVEPNGVNLACNAGFIWRERALEPSEAPLSG